MPKLKNNNKGFTVVELLLVIVTLAIIGVVGYLVANHVDKKPVAANNTNSSSTNTTSNKATGSGSNTTTSTNPYAGWKSYSNSQVSFKYPGTWEASNGPGSSQSTVADVTSTAFTTSAVTTANNPSGPITLYLQLSTSSSTIDCVDAPCRVASVAPLNNSQLPGAVLAIVNQTSGNGTKFTEYVVANSGTKVGDTTISAAKAGNNVYVFGQAYYTPSGGGLTEASRVTDDAAFQADSHFKDLINLINSIKFN